MEIKGQYINVFKAITLKITQSDIEYNEENCMQENIR